MYGMTWVANHVRSTVTKPTKSSCPCHDLFYVSQFIQPRTQALHCFYRDQWQLINAKRARVLGQHAKKPSAQGC